MADVDVAPSRDQAPVTLQVKEQACAEPDLEKDVARQDNNNELGGPVSSNEQDGAAPAEHDAATTTTPALHSASRTHHHIPSACRSQPEPFSPCPLQWTSSSSSSSWRPCWRHGLCPQGVEAASQCRCGQRPQLLRPCSCSPQAWAGCLCPAGRGSSASRSSSRL